MKLCKLFHESADYCPTCGSVIDSFGKTVKSKKSKDRPLLVFPDKDGIWRDPYDGRILYDPNNSKTTEQLDQEESEADTWVMNKLDKPKDKTEILPPPKTPSLDEPRSNQPKTDTYQDVARKAKRARDKKLKGNKRLAQVLLRYRKQIADENR